MPPSCSQSAVAPTRRRTRALTFSLLLAVMGLAALASAETVTVGEAQLEGLDFFDVPSCDIAAPEAC
jgi:hypothetical protein